MQRFSTRTDDARLPPREDQGMKNDGANLLTMARRLLAAGIVLLALTACGSNIPIYGPPGKAQVPSDFPVYAGAAPTSEIYGASPLADGSKDRRERYDVTWTSADNGGKLFAYYKVQLAQGDWVEQSTSGDSNRGGLIVFNRKSSTTWGGSILLADGKIHVIMGDGCPCGVPT
jgi:predicted small lipoprotein YifL